MEKAKPSSNPTRTRRAHQIQRRFPWTRLRDLGHRSPEAALAPCYAACLSRRTARRRDPGAGLILERHPWLGELPLPSRRPCRRPLGPPQYQPGDRLSCDDGRADVARAVPEPLPPALAQAEVGGREPRDRALRLG